MDDWAEKQANAVREKRKKEQIEKETRLLDDKQKNAEAPGLWREFLAGVSSKVGEFNRALGEHALTLRNEGNDDVSVGAHDFLTAISAHFDSERLEVRCMLVGTGSDYSIEIRDGRVTFVKGRSRSGTTSHAISPDNMAQEFVSEITKFA
jgi:hypothetical protein